MTARAVDWQRVADLADRRLAPSYGRVASAAQLALHPERDTVAVVGEVRESLLAPAKTVVALLGHGEPQVLREGWLPTWSPDGTRLAHLDGAGVQVGDLHRVLTGSPERLGWRGDGSALLVVVADPGSELANITGSGLACSGGDSWLPHVESTDRHDSWRRLVLLDVVTGEATTVGRADLNVWDAVWAGDDAILCVCSDGASDESAWYTADLRLLTVSTGEDRVVATPRDQLGPIAASPSGRRIAYVASIASDRGVVAGDLLLLDLDTAGARRLAAPVDVSDVAFVDEDTLGFAGLVGLETRVGLVSVEGDVQSVWSSVEQSAAGVLPTASFRGTQAALARSGYDAPPEVVVTDGATERVLGRLWAEPPPPAAATTRVHRWTAPDGQELEGWLHLPDGPGPHPLVVGLHGGPVGSHRSAWSAVGVLRPHLLALGYALLMPNPRGSCGRGQEFARAVVGDMGGADADDITSGVASLVEAGVADPTRVGVTGGSYGGFLAAWLVTQTDVFAAAVPLHPVCDWREQHGSSCIPGWDELFLDGKPYAGGQYVERSPVTHVASARTPTLLIAGALDRATPPGQALAMHRALAAHGVATECVTYPTAGHGARDLPSIVDQAARVADWFGRFMPPTPTTP